MRMKVPSLFVVRAALIRVAKAGAAHLAQSLLMIHVMVAGMSLPTQSVLLMDTPISLSALQSTVEGIMLKIFFLDHVPTMYVYLSVNYHSVNSVV